MRYAAGVAEQRVSVFIQPAAGIGVFQFQFSLKPLESWPFSADKSEV
jgi:hypothetical protein